METLLHWDQAVFHSINQFHHPILDILFLWVTQFRHFTWITLILLLTFLSKRKDRWRITVFTLLLLMATDLLSHEILKPLIDRSRPCQALEDISLLVPCPRSPSFPSTHAMNIFAIAVFLGFYYPNCVGLLGLATLLVSLSRIYTGVHYPLDILGGAIIGTSLAFLWRALEKKVFKLNG